MKEQEKEIQRVIDWLYDGSMSDKEAMEIILSERDKFAMDVLNFVDMNYVRLSHRGKWAYFHRNDSDYQEPNNFQDVVDKYKQSLELFHSQKQTQG